MSVVDDAMRGARRRHGQDHSAAFTKTVLVIVHTMVYGQRLREMYAPLLSDPRIRLTFTIAPHKFDEGASRFVRSQIRPTMPWGQAVRMPFDLALAAGARGIEQVSAPVVLVPHGASHIKLARSPDMRIESVEHPVHGLSRDYLTRNGRVVPKVLVLAHEEERAELRRSCPEALPAVEVVGDPFFDRIMMSLPRRAEYRRALGLGAGQKLTVACLTWQPDLPSSHLKTLLTRLKDELKPPVHRTVLLIHPNAREGAAGLRLNTLLNEFRHHGIEAIRPETDWRPLLVAADWIIGDHGSISLYSTASRTPIVLARFPSADVNPVSPAVELALAAPRLSPSPPLPEQLAAAAAGYRHEHHAAVAARISSEPGRFHRNFTRLLYRLLAMDPPAQPPAVEPLPPPLSLPNSPIRFSSRLASRGLLPL